MLQESGFWGWILGRYKYAVFEGISKRFHVECTAITYELFSVKTRFLVWIFVAFGEGLEGQFGEVLEVALSGRWERGERGWGNGLNGQIGRNVLGWPRVVRAAGAGLGQGKSR